ncbi:hypothetical protein FB45DRAFT_828768 [Roridomyces roridus]|uniref:GATA-type domain-containing protein n=1 Tax=Roridomyces roridus TaxID=1738132 RepID=A0AAD7FPZ9_9AGAR|nr:hypothetical protein FB45DRAFT_828768 [Roridomyces roridus]
MVFRSPLPMTALKFNIEDTSRPSPRYAYGGPDRSYPYHPHRTDIHASPHGCSYAHHQPAPTVDFSGLIPMYDPVSPSARNGVVELPYYTEWPPSYPTVAGAKSAQPVWYPSSPEGHSSGWNSSPQRMRYTEYIPYSPPSSTTSSSSNSSPPPSSSSPYFPTPPSAYNSLPRVSVSVPRRPGNTNTNGTPGLGLETPKKSCSHCHVTSTPLWRRDPSTQRPLCNACGLYLQQRNKLRPQELIDADNDDPDDAMPQISDADYTGPKCSHCLTRHTSVWRRSKTGAQVCNACGVYARLRGKERPLSLRRNKIKPRTKHSR